MIQLADFSARSLLHAGFLPGLFSTETSVDFERTTRRYIPEHRILHNYRCDNSHPTNEYLSDQNLRVERLKRFLKTLQIQKNKILHIM
jgi:hypothetical protein